MVQTARPNSTRFVIAWTGSGCAIPGRAWQCIDDNPLVHPTDTDYLASSSLNAVFAVRLDNGITDPATYGHHKVRIRAAKITMGGVGSFGLTPGVYVDTTLIESLGELIISGAYSVYEWTMTPSLAKLLAGNYPGVELWIGLTTAAISSGTPECRIQAAEFVAPDVGSVVAIGAGVGAGSAQVEGHTDLVAVGDGVAIGTAQPEGHTDLAATGAGVAGASVEVEGHTDLAASAAGVAVGSVQAEGHTDLAATGAGVAVGSAQVEGHTDLAANGGGKAWGRAHTSPAYPKHYTKTITPAMFADAGGWLLAVPDFAEIQHLRIFNQANERVGVVIRDGVADHILVDDGDDEHLDLHHVSVRGPIFVRGAPDPTSGNVRIEADFK